MSSAEGTALVATNGAAAMQLAYELGADPTATSLDFRDPEMSYQDWENIGRSITFVGNAWQWWVGDWINVGEALFGEDAAQAIDDRPSRYDLARRVTGLEQGTLQNIRSVCGRVSKLTRRAELPFSHHQEVAALDPGEQAEWLQKAIDGLWSKSDLRTALREAKAPTVDDVPPPPPDDPGAPEVLPEGYLSVSERIERAARLVANQASPTTDGDWIVPAEAMAQLSASLGGE